MNRIAAEDVIERSADRVGLGPLAPRVPPRPRGRRVRSHLLRRIRNEGRGGAAGYLCCLLGRARVHDPVHCSGGLTTDTGTGGVRGPDVGRAGNGLEIDADRPAVGRGVRVVHGS